MADCSIAGEACGVTSLSSARAAGRAAGFLLVEIERLVIGLLVPHHLPEVVSVYLLAADGARMEMLRPFSVMWLAGLRRSKVNNFRHHQRTRRPGKSSGGCVCMRSKADNKTPTPEGE
ncbi:hypothetical protein NKI96_15680 [Mesorhizobium sp. M0292]|uniref:hypothetical protein n=1 Tax=Mesorhizobium sp. M0292 TaxID=2956929 RepID=UPI0033356FA3